MVCKISVIPSGTVIPGLTDVFSSPYSYYRIRIDDFVWYIAISSTVKAVKKVITTSTPGDVDVVIACDISGKQILEEETLCLAYDARTKLRSKTVANLVRRVDRWKLDEQQEEVVVASV